MRYVRQTMLHMKAGVPTLILNERVDPGTVRMGVSSIERNAIFGRRIALALAWNTTERQKHLFTLYGLDRLRQRRHFGRHYLWVNWPLTSCLEKRKQRRRG